MAKLLRLRLDLAPAEAVDALPGARRSSRTGMARSATVSGSLPMPAMAFGQKVEKSLNEMFAPWPTQTVVLPPRRWPLFRTPRSASAYSLSPAKAASDSSSSRVGESESCGAAPRPSSCR
jgi:hypothetical protein